MSHRSITRAFVVALMAVLPWPFVAELQVRAQAPVAPAEPEVPRSSVSPDDAAVLAEGWAMLAKGDVADAGRRADDVLSRSPRSVSALSLAVDASLAGGGSSAGLGQYEQWLGSRTTEEPAILRAIARALLIEAAGDERNPTARSAALDALARAGETAMLDAELRKKAYAGSATETQALAAGGDKPALQMLIAQLSIPGNKLGVIEAIAATKEPAAVAPLENLLHDPTVETRTAAIDALGEIGDPSAVPSLQAAFHDPSGYVRLHAASALYRLGDASGIELLQNLARSSAAKDRVFAAKALAAQPDGAWMTLVRGLISNPDPDIRLDAATLLAKQDPDSARPVLQQLAQDTNPAVRDQAMLALIQDLPGDLTGLRTWLRSGNRMVRVNAAGRILELTN
jgi:HEAT repeat protein